MRLVTLTRGYFSLVCDCHYSLVGEHKWQARTSKDGKVYATSKVAGKMVTLHRLVNRTPKGLLTDHINGYTLDNQCLNLRSCTNSENQRNRRKQANNTSGYKGVTFDRDQGKWRAQVLVNKKIHHLGRFNSPVEAAATYDRYVLAHFGYFAKPNMI